MNTAAATALLSAIASKGIELAVKLGHLDPATATEEQAMAAGTAAVFAAMEMEPQVKEAMLHITAERFHAAHSA